jgi:hypothetical protein
MPSNVGLKIKGQRPRRVASERETVIRFAAPSLVEMADKYVGDSQHKPTVSASRINRAVKKAGENAAFIDESVATLREMHFPAFKETIVKYARGSGAPDDVIALFESLDGYIEYRDLYHLQKSLEENNAGRKNKYQLTDKTRTDADVRTRPKDAGASITDREASSEKEQRKDFPEVPPSAMSNFICDRCGKAFQNQHDLVKHRQFESGTSVS